jgi:MerR family transcriptional regulator, light-induced transcriptional regulator
MHAFTIKDLENLSGIKAHTIRIWEQRYSFLSPNRTDTNIRYYTNEELKTLLNVALLNKYGYKISHIDKMSETDLTEKIRSLSSFEAQQERLLNDLINHTINLQLDDFEKIIDSYIANKGIEKTITQIIFPYLERIGILWITNHINPAQEHLVTNVIRQKLIIGIETATPHVNLGQTILLFLPEGEHHELGLLYMYYMLKVRGIKVIYLGSNVPIADIKFLSELKKPDFLYTHLTSVANNFNFEKFLNNAASKIPNIPIVISGQLVQTYKKKLPENIRFMNSLSEVMGFIASL